MSRNESLEILISDLNSLGDFLHDVYQLNYGGCCLFAYLVAVELEFRDIKYDLIVADDIKMEKQNILEEIRYKKVFNNAYQNSVLGYNTKKHYFLRIKPTAESINSFHSYSNYITIPSPSSETIRWIWEHGIWNETFDSYTFEDNIQQHIQLIFNKYDNN